MSWRRRINAFNSYESWSYESFRDRFREDLKEAKRKQGGRGLFQDMTTDSSVREIGSRIITNMIIAQSYFFWLYIGYHFVRGSYYSLVKTYKLVANGISNRTEWIKDKKERRKEGGKVMDGKKRNRKK